MYNNRNSGEIEYQRRISEYMDSMVDDKVINLQRSVDAPNFRITIGERNFVKERERWVEECNNERRYLYQAYRHSVGASFIG